MKEPSSQTDKLYLVQKLLNEPVLKVKEVHEIRWLAVYPFHIYFGKILIAKENICELKSTFPRHFVLHFFRSHQWFCFFFCFFHFMFILGCFLKGS